MLLFYRLIIGGLFIITSTLASAQERCANDRQIENGEPDPKTKGGTCTFDTYTGNEFREIRDLEVWGGSGEMQLAWIRYGNSRFNPVYSPYGEAHNWSSSFFYLMEDFNSVPPVPSERPHIKITFPDGANIVYIKDAKDTSRWYSSPAVTSQIFQTGNIFFLQTDDGYRYRFEKLRSPANSGYYQLQDFRDIHQNLYTLEYDTSKRLKRITEPAGRFLEITYEMISNVSVIKQVGTNDGRKVLYHYTDTPVNDTLVTNWIALDTVYYGDGTKAAYSYSQRKPGSRPVLAHAIDPRVVGDGVNMKYAYSDSVRVTGYIRSEINGVTDAIMATLDQGLVNNVVCYANGKFETFVLPTSQRGQLHSHTDGLGRITDYEYFKNDLGFLKSMTDMLARKTIYNKRTIYGNLLEVIYPDGTKEKWNRDDLDLILTHTDELNRITKYTRDARHRVTQISYPDGSFERFTYNDFGKILYHRKKNGSIDHFVYDTTGLLIQFTDTLRNSTFYKYDSAGRLALVKNALGHTTGYNYNERGLLIKMTNADSSYKRYKYDDYGNQTEITNELNNTWTTKYDEFRRPVSMTDPLNRITNYGYDLPGGIIGSSHNKNKPTKITFPSGKITEIEYDVEWRKIRETIGAGTPEAATTFYEYDLVGNLLIIIDPKEKIWRTDYDKRDRRISSIDPLGNKTGYKYDLVGNLIEITRPDSGIIVKRYDKMNRNTIIIDPKKQITRMVYDSAGNMVKLTDPKNHVYRFNYDLLNRKTKMTYPDFLFEEYTYDSVSNLKTYKTRGGPIRTFEYDSRNREIKSSWPLNNITPAINSDYDDAGNLLSMHSSLSLLTYRYNEANELTSESQAIAGAAGAKTIKYSYLKDGLRDSITYPDGTIIRYAYTGRNQVDSIIENNIALSQYTYDLNGNRLTKTLNNGTDTRYTYDDVNRLTGLLNRKAITPFASFNYGYDNMSRRTFVKRGNGMGDVYSYDSIGQVIKVLYEVSSPDSVPGNPARAISYQLDSAGNRLTATNNGTVTNYTANKLNQYINVGDSGLSYTKNGDLSKFNGWAFTYDSQKRLIAAKKSDTVMSFAYDPLNRCVQRKLTKGKVILSNTFLYYDGWNLIEERTSLDSQMARYVHGVMTDEILTKTSNNKPIYYHHDALGSVVRLTDINGKMVERYISDDVFGKTSIRDANGKALPESAFGNRFLFSGREYLKEIKLYDYRNRMYSDSLGRFLQIDPIRFDARDYNLYRYVFNNAINKLDLFGLSDDEYSFDTDWRDMPSTNPPSIPGLEPDKEYEGEDFGYDDEDFGIDDSPSDNNQDIGKQVKDFISDKIGFDVSPFNPFEVTYPQDPFSKKEPSKGYGLCVSFKF